MRISLKCVLWLPLSFAISQFTPEQGDWNHALAVLYLTLCVYAHRSCAAGCHLLKDQTMSTWMLWKIRLLRLWGRVLRW